MGIAMEMRGDGAYDTRKIFLLLAKLDITPMIRVRIDSNARVVDRALAILERLGGKGGCANRDLNRMMKDECLANQKYWKERARYGLRRIVGDCHILLQARVWRVRTGVDIRYDLHRDRHQGGRVQPQHGHLDEAVRRMRDGYEASKLPEEQMQFLGAAT